MTNLRKELDKCKHPNSRKTKALGKKARRQNNKHKVRLGHAIKSNIMGEKLTWFLGQIAEDRTTPLTPQEFEDLIALYMQRFDEELAQINLKQSIGKHRANQHAARKDVITITLEKERNEYKSGGMELVNLCDPLKLKMLRDWDGSALSVQHLKLDLVSYNMLERLKKPEEKLTSTKADEQMETA
ncbi:translation machinery-associated protein 16 homolog [Drosophila guanche]|uniref:Blast:Translation machinery-associated protein 16 homolog n=1 Tax=Drosophila guanche TaxID=7266 RepID=A0A3B0JZM8_DROGU|nr:translation machinery-associated protein 16 homolog [Drosophila guanche]SPP78816.1 blast:Translation machinery-associated protein 16 homolog [Drosophila guanche]